MATLTSVELGASGRYIDLGSPAVLDDMGAQTILTYCRPSGSGGGGFAYIYGKVPSGSINGPRYFITHNTGAPRITMGAHSNIAGRPDRTSANDVAVYNSWQHIAFTWDGSLTAANMLMYIGIGADLAEVSYSATGNGATAVVSDASNEVFLMNRAGLGREFVGDVAYIAVWNRVLNLTELVNAQNNGPLDEPTGLVLLWANQADLGPNALTPDDRSTFVAGTLPPNTALGGADDEAVGSSSGVATVTGLAAAEVESVGASAGVAVVTGLAPDVAGEATGASAGTAVVTGVGAAEVGAVGSSAGVATVVGLSPPIAVLDDFEGSSVNVVGSSIAGTGDSAVISLQPRLGESEVVSSQTRWLAVKAKVTGVNGIRPTFELLDYGSGDGFYHGHPWQSGRRMLFSYDFVTWTHFDTAHTLTGGKVTFRHSTAFTSDTVYVAWCRVRTPTMARAWVDALASAHPTLISDTPSSTGFNAGTYSAQTDELGRTVPAQEFLAFKISDASLSPPAGQVKRTLVMEADMHGGEDNSGFAMQHAVEFLCSSDAQAQNVRANFDVFVYPMMNPVGRAGGHWRGSWENGTGGADDGNRHFQDVTPPIELVSIPRAAMIADLPSVVQVALSWHGAYSKKYSFYQDVGVTEHALWDAAMETYLGAGLSEDTGTTVSGFVAAWFRDQRSTGFYITTETGEPTPLSDADLQTWGESHVKVISDLLDNGDIPAVFDSAVGSSDGVAVVTGLAAADVEATGEVEGVATVTGLSESEAGAVGSSDGQATVSGEAAAETGSVGDAAGVAAVDGQAASEAGSVGESEGSAAVAGESGAEAGSVGSSAGSSTVTGLSEVGSSVGSAAGTATVEGQAAAEVESVGAAAGLATVLGESDFEIGSVGESTGTSAVTGISGADKGSVGSAAGVAVVSGLGDFVGSEPIVKWPVQRSVTIVDQRHTVEIVA